MYCWFLHELVMPYTPGILYLPFSFVWIAADVVAVLVVVTYVAKHYKEHIILLLYVQLLLLFVLTPVVIA